MRNRWVGLLILGLAFAFVIAVYPRLPDVVPTHWGISGEADGWGRKWPSVFILPGMGLFIWLLMNVLPRLGPRREHIERAEDTWWLLVNVIMLFILFMTIVMLAPALGWPVDVGRLIVAGVGLLFVAIGNFLPRIRSNWWMGIRTPWTMDNEMVWRETHRVGGLTMVIGGLTGALAMLLPLQAGIYIAMGAFAAAGLIPAVYSYFLWRRYRGGRA